MVMIHPSAGNTLTLRVSLQRVPGTLGKLTSALGAAGALVDAIDIIEHPGDVIIRQIQVETRGEAHGLEVVEAARSVSGVELLTVSDRVFDRHLGGKIEVTPKFPVLTRDDLSMAYTPGVGRVCTAIGERPELVWDYTIKSNAVAVLTDGTAILGLGDLGPEAAMPVMEGKAMLFKQLANVDAYPICVRTKGVEELVAVAKAIAPGFGGINLEDVAAPECFEVERRLQEELDIPVFHDDQHGTAIVSLAALYGAAEVVGKRLEDLKVVFLGMGAAGVACIKLWQHAGVGNFIGLDRKGIVCPERTDLNAEKRSIAETTNPEGVRGGLEEALGGRRRLRRRQRSRPGQAGLDRHHGQGRHRVRDGQPDPGDHAGGDAGQRGGGRHRPQRLREPDQQRPGIPGSVPRVARQPRTVGGHVDEGCCCPGAGRHRGRGRGICGLHHPLDLRCPGGAGGGQGSAEGRGLGRTGHGVHAGEDRPDLTP